MVVIGRKERGGKKCLGLSKVCHFCYREGYWKKDCKYRQEWLKKKGQTAEANIADGVLDINVLTIFIDNTCTDKG